MGDQFRVTTLAGGLGDGLEADVGRRGLWRRDLDETISLEEELFRGMNTHTNKWETRRVFQIDSVRVSQRA